MIEPILIKPFLALIFISIACAFLGVFVLWKKMSYFSDSLSHSIILGFTLGAIFDSNQIFVLISFAIFFAILVEFLSQNQIFSQDSFIAISSYFCISSAILLNDIFQLNLNLGSYIFGDILTVGNVELATLSAITIAVLIYSILAAKKILLININPDFAKIEKVKTTWWNLSFSILLALTIALSVRIVGVFLMTALLILPAAIARIFSYSIKQMIVTSTLISIVISTFSFGIADHFNLTISAVVIAVFCLVFISSFLIKNILRHA